jgi:chorismate dehydratase
MGKIRISAVKYANTYPFMYGLVESGFEKKVVLQTDHPADCAAKLIADKVDIGLIPAAALPLLKEYKIISDYCIGATRNVRTVLLLSNCEFSEIKTIYLDYRSRSSINLTKVLAKNYWLRDFSWVNTSKGFDFLDIAQDEGVVLIGDQCFEYEKSFKNKVDLALEWEKFSGLPFVFACWTANKYIENQFIEEFNASLALGVNNIDRVVDKYGQTGIISGIVLKNYLTENISFDFDEDKKKGLKLFLELMAGL